MDMTEALLHGIADAILGTTIVEYQGETLTSASRSGA
jgi:lysyl-tRNA synthetase class II